MDHDRQPVAGSHCTGEGSGHLYDDSLNSLLPAHDCPVSLPVFISLPGISFLLPFQVVRIEFGSYSLFSHIFPI